MNRVLRPRAALLLGALLAPALGACDTPTAMRGESISAPGRPALATVPAKGAANTLDVASWNIEWFGDTSNGPSNETLQLSNARDVIAGTDFDVWGVAEIAGQTQWNSLESQLTGYTGFLASESTVTNGSAYYGATEQKVGILYKSSVATLLGAKVILTANDADFAGRPPLEVKLRVTLNGATEDVVVIVLHMKAFNDAASWQRRQNASVALKTYLDATYPTQKVIVVGDWNDDVDTSITSGSPSPYQNFVGDAADYAFPTRALSLAGVSSTTSYPDMIDHHLDTDELYAALVPGSTEVYRVDSYVASYDATTSDHFPVLSRYTWGNGGGTPGSVTLTAPNGGESWAGGSVQSVTWTATGVANVKLEYTLDGIAWSTIAASTPAAAGSWAWTVPSTASTAARVRVSDAANAAVSDASDAAFTVTAPASTPAQVILNEIMANEPGSNTAAEFVEIVNVGGTSISIAGWTLSDGAGVKHTFAAGTTLAPGKAIVVFAGASAIPAGLANAVAASTGSLALGNSGDSVILKNGATTVTSYSYPSSLSSTDGVSMNRSPDTSATGSFVLHTALGSLSSSAGTRANGTAF
ncbi:MAG TPA: lamin tail domain-containing protein [Longimicrobiaceae bacterium]|jgi:endonuclease/exonuclease/phosphatase family metal-dependent hydrolase